VEAVERERGIGRIIVELIDEQDVRRDALDDFGDPPRLVVRRDSKVAGQRAGGPAIERGVERGDAKLQRSGDHACSQEEGKDESEPAHLSARTCATRPPEQTLSGDESASGDQRNPECGLGIRRTRGALAIAEAGLDSVRRASHPAQRLPLPRLARRLPGLHNFQIRISRSQTQSRPFHGRREEITVLQVRPGAGVRAGFCAAARPAAHAHRAVVRIQPGDDR